MTLAASQPYEHISSTIPRLFPVTSSRSSPAKHSLFGVTRAGANMIGGHHVLYTELRGPWQRDVVLFPLDAPSAHTFNKTSEPALDLPSPGHESHRLED